MTWAIALHDLQGALIVSALAIGCLVAAEVLGRVTTLPTELTRKFAHIGSGFAVLLIPVFITSSWSVLALSAAFAGLMLGTQALGLLGAVHGVGRGVGGVLWYPATAWITFVAVYDVMHGPYLMFAMPILVLACADAMGAVVGRRWGRHRYEVMTGHFRSLEGSLAFAVVAFICVALPLSVGLQVEPGRAALIALLVAVIATACEAVSTHGLDNVLVPIGTLVFLDRFITLDIAELLVQGGVLAGVIGVSLTVARMRPATGGGIAATMLATYCILASGGLAWLPPLAGFALVCVAVDRLTCPRPERAPTPLDLQSALIGLSAPVALALTHAAVDRPDWQHAIWVAYLATISCQVMLLSFLVPQHPDFRARRIRRVLSAPVARRHAPTIGNLGLAGLAATVALAGAAAWSRETTSAEVATIAVACVLAMFAFWSLGLLQRSQQACPACGNVTLRGISCCRMAPRSGAAVSAPIGITVQSAYLASTSVAAAACGVIVLGWLQ